MFEESLVRSAGGARNPLAFAASVVLQVSLIGLLAVGPLLSTSETPSVWLSGILRAPSVPTSPPAKPGQDVSAGATEVAPRQFQEERLLRPSEIPKEVALIADTDQPPALFTGRGATAGSGPPEGMQGIIIGAIPGDSGSIPLPPPVPLPPANQMLEQPSEPETPRLIRVGGKVKPPVLLTSVEPVYPRLALQMRASGTVRLECIIGVDGRLASIRVVSGHPLLAQAALEAVRQWRYQPTTLNGEPVQVAMRVRVTFRPR